MDKVGARSMGKGAHCQRLRMRGLLWVGLQRLLNGVLRPLSRSTLRGA